MDGPDLANGPLGQDGQAVAEGESLGAVVGHDEGRHAEAMEKRPKLAAELLSRGSVERRERLVEQEEPRPRRDGPGKRHPLPLATGELSGPASQQVLDPEKLRDLPHPRALLRRLQPMQSVPDVLLDREVRKERVVLEE